MRIPKEHFLTLQYIEEFGLTGDLFPFEQENKFIFLEGYGKTLTYDKFNELLQARDSKLLSLFPGLKGSEKGKTCDELFTEAVEPVKTLFMNVYNDDPKNIVKAYKAITKKYDCYTLRSYLVEVAKWSEAAINLYDVGNAHVVFENGFIESWKDAFLSSNTGGGEAGMKQLQEGMDGITGGFIRSKVPGRITLIDNITFGARVTCIDHCPGAMSVKLTYDTGASVETAKGHFLIIAIPYPSLRMIQRPRPFSPGKEAAIRSVRYVEVTKVLLQYQKRWWETIFAKHGQGHDGGVVTDLPIRYIMFPKKEGSHQAEKSERGVVIYIRTRWYIARFHEFRKQNVARSSQYSPYFPEVQISSPFRGQRSTSMARG